MPTPLDRPQLDTALARLLHQDGRVELATLQALLAGARQERGAAGPSLARALVARGVLAEPEALAYLAQLEPAAPPPTATDLATGGRSPPTRLGAYELADELGAGGMGRVYRARHVETGAEHAIKVLPLGSDPELVARFRREGAAQAAVDAHPHVARVHSAGVEGGRLYLVMDLCPGGDLQARLERGPLDPEEAAEIVRDLARGLAHAHAAGVLHRDLKPANVLFAEGGVPKLVDFGLARVVGEQSLTASGTVLGTPGYMAPEQARGEGHRVDERADVYGLGALLYACLTGHAPFRGRAVLDVLRQVLEVPPRPPRAERPDVHPELEQICLRALAKRPEDRFASAAALADALERFLQADPRGGPSPRALLAGALLFGMVVSSLLGAWLLRDVSSAPGPAAEGGSAAVSTVSAGGAADVLPAGSAGGAHEPSVLERALASATAQRAAVPLPESGLRRGEASLDPELHAQLADASEALVAAASVQARYWAAASGDPRGLGPEVQAPLARTSEELVRAASAEARYWWARAAASGHPRALLELEERIARGELDGSDPDRVALLRAATATDPPPPDAADPRRWIEAQAEAWSVLAHRYRSGEGVLISAQDEVRCLREAARLGDGPAAATFADRLLAGQGTAQDAAAAATWYRTAAERGEAWGALRLGLLLAAGWGVPRNSAEAFSAFERVILHPHPHALMRAQAHAWLGRLLREGHGPRGHTTPAEAHFEQGWHWSTLLQIPESWRGDPAVQAALLDRYPDVEVELWRVIQSGLPADAAADEVFLLYGDLGAIVHHALREAAKREGALAYEYQASRTSERVRTAYEPLIARDARAMFGAAPLLPMPSRAERRRAAAQAGWPPAMLIVAATARPAEARAWRERAARAGDPTALRYLGPQWLPAPEVDEVAVRADPEAEDAWRAARDGDPARLRALADRALARGERAQAAAWYARAANHGDVVARVEWALMQLGRRDPEGFAAHAFLVLERVTGQSRHLVAPGASLEPREARARRKAMVACARLRLERGCRPEQSRGFAAHDLQLASQWGSPAAWTLQGDLLLRGELLAQEPSQAFERYARAAAVAHVPAVWRQALLLAEGWGVPRDEQKAVSLLRQHVGPGAPGDEAQEADRARALLAALVRDGRGVAAKDPALALELLAPVQGAFGWFGVAEVLRRATPAARPAKTAADYWRVIYTLNTLEQDRWLDPEERLLRARAAWRFSRLLAKAAALAQPHGAPAVHARAALREASELANRGDARAALLVAEILLAQASGPPFDPAATYLRQAAAKGLPEAMVRLSELLAAGHATPQRPNEASDLLQRAAAQGHPRAMRK